MSSTSTHYFLWSTTVTLLPPLCWAQECRKGKRRADPRGTAPTATRWCLEIPYQRMVLARVAVLCIMVQAHNLMESMDRAEVASCVSWQAFCCGHAFCHIAIFDRDHEADMFNECCTHWLRSLSCGSLQSVGVKRVAHFCDHFSLLGAMSLARL